MKDQAIATWLNNVTNVTTFVDNKRLAQFGISSGEIAKRKEVCQTLLGIHQSYPEQMKFYWDIYQKENRSIVYHPPPVEYPCPFPRKFDYKAFLGTEGYHDMKLCKDNPTWSSMPYVKGRQGT